MSINLPRRSRRNTSTSARSRSVSSTREKANLQRTIHDKTKALKRLAVSTGYGQEYWKEQETISILKQQELDIREEDAYSKYTGDEGSALDKDTWTRNHEKGQEFQRLKGNFRSWQKVSARQARKLDARKSPLKQARKGLYGLFLKSDLGVGKASTRNTSLQSRMRRDMIVQYNAENERGQLWEPILCQYLDPSWIHAAHLYPYKSAAVMETIFGEGSQQELFTARNGLLLYKSVERALEMGSITIIPYIPMADNNPGAHPTLDNQLLEEWENSPVKEYRLWVLRKDVKEVREPFRFTNENFDLLSLHGNKLEFKSDVRPAARFVWWVHMTAVFRAINWQKEEDAAVKTEVQNATRFWGTKGRYVMNNVLQTFVDHMGHTLDKQSRECIASNGNPVGSEEFEDATAVAVMSSDALVHNDEEEDENVGVLDSDDEFMDPEGY